MRIATPILAALVTLVMCEAGSAQGLFGQRDLGTSIGKQPGPGAAAASNSSTLGAIDGNRRFVRDARAANDFVGSNTSAEAATGFVGGQGVATTATSSVVGLTEEARPPINRPRIVRPTGLYAERLTLAEDAVRQPQTTTVQPALSEGLLSFIQSHSMTLEVSSEDHSVTLRGAVASERDRQTTQLLVMFEPGIQKVENHLTVDPSLPPLQRRPRSPKSN